LIDVLLKLIKENADSASKGLEKSIASYQLFKKTFFI
jgi:hypothetical protein